MLGSILLPTDFSAAAVHTARCARSLAARFGARLTLLHALPEVDRSLATLEGGGVLLDEVLDYQRMVARGRLEELAERELNGAGAGIVLVEKDPAEAIAEFARSSPVDLVMMPTRGCGPFRRFILGSVTAKVLHDVACPVWTGTHVEEMPPEASSIRTVLCALDLSGTSDLVLNWAARLAERLGAALSVAHAIPSLDAHPEIHYMESDLRRFLVGRAREKITGMLEAVGRPEAGIVVRGGTVSEVVRAAAQEAGADVAVIGRADNDSLMGRLRTNSYAIIRDCPCPVVSV